MMQDGASLSRRAALAGLAGAALAPGWVPGPALAKGAVRYGAAAMKEDFEADPRYREALLRHCDVIVPMNDLKWEALRPSRDRFAFEDADRIVGFALKHGKGLRGHALCWYNALPDWTKEIAGPREAERELVRHIDTVVGRYRGRIPSWDVVNEAIAHDPRKELPWRDTLWQRWLGAAHVEIAFRAAAAADPKAELVYNDYDLENVGERQALRRGHALALVRRLQDRNVPIHAVGFQAHLYAEQAIDVEGVGKFVSDLKALGVHVLVTELDVIDWRLPADPQARDEAAAAHVATFLQAVGAAGSPRDIVTWGITDRYSWIPEHFKRSDGLPNRPLPLDADYRPKPMLQAIERYRRTA